MGTSGQILKFWDSFCKLRTSEARNFRFGRWMELEKFHLMEDKTGNKMANINV